MKSGYYLILSIGVLLLSLICIPPIFVGRHGSNLLVYTLVFTFIGTPIFLLTSQMISTISFIMSSIFTNRKIIYCYLCPFLYFNNRLASCLIFSQIFGFSPAVYLEDNRDDKYLFYFYIYLSFYVIFQLLVFWLGIHFVPLRGILFPIIPFSLIPLFHTGIFLDSYRNFYKYKSKVLTVLIRDRAIVELTDIFDETISKNNEIYYQLLCYLVLIKDKLVKEEVEIVVGLENSFYKAINNIRDYYAFLDIIKINLYSYRKNEYEYYRYKDLLDTWAGVNEYNYLLLNNIYKQIEIDNILDVSLAVSEIPIILELLKQ